MINISVTQDKDPFGLKPKFNTNLLKPKDKLFPKFWKNNILDHEVGKRLLEIANNVIDSMDIKPEIEDIIITGSICSYNWHKFSDIDLHIIFDFEAINENFNLVKKMLDQSRINWNKTHDIRIGDKEVELYFQDSNEPHESNGIWSLLSSKWLVEPVRLNPELDLKTAEKKAESLAKAIDHLSELVNEKNFEEAFTYASKIKFKISRMRKAGIEKEGIYSPENLAFKMLRYAGYLEKLSFLKVLSYDKMMSMDIVTEVKDYFKSSSDSEYLKFDNHPQSTIEKLMSEDELAPWETKDA